MRPSGPPAADPPEVWQQLGDSIRPVLVLDFDGTVCVGDAPVWAYADAVIDLLRTDGTPDIDAFADRVRHQLAAFLDGAPDAPLFPDGYAAVATLAAGVADPAQLGAAYLASRTAMAAGGAADVTAPPGLAELLADLRGKVWRMVLTNAPADGVAGTLRQIGVGGEIDVIVTDAGKPDGWSNLLPALLCHRAPESVLTVGDIWANDLAQPLTAGVTTALIDRFGHRAGPAHAAGPDFPALYPAVRHWAADPNGFAATHRPEPVPGT